MKSQERKQFLFEVFITALEGSIGYWACASKYKWIKEGSTDHEEDLDNFHAIVSDAEDEEAFPDNSIINQATIVTGINKIIKGEVQINETMRKRITEASKENDAGIIDGDDADAIAQVGLLGEIMFG